jgi:hypothetical protein
MNRTDANRGTPGLGHAWRRSRGTLSRGGLEGWNTTWSWLLQEGERTKGRDEVQGVPEKNARESKWAGTRRLNERTRAGRALGGGVMR